MINIFRFIKRDTNPRSGNVYSIIRFYDRFNNELYSLWIGSGKGNFREASGGHFLRNNFKDFFEYLDYHIKSSINNNNIEFELISLSGDMKISLFSYDHPLINSISRFKTLEEVILKIKNDIKIADARRRELVVEHLLLGTIRFLAERHPVLLNELEGSVDHLCDKADDELRDDEAVKYIARTFIANLRAETRTHSASDDPQAVR